MNGQQISQALNQKELNFSLVAQACGTSASHIRNVAYRLGTSAPVANKIARALGRPFDEVFPDYATKRNAKAARAKRVKQLAKIVND